MPSLISLFAGIGGLDLGFRAAGFDVVAAYDFDRYACATYRANVGPEIVQRDIRDMTGAEIPAADVWAGGFPCQDVSISGKRAGLNGARTGMFWEWMRLLDEVKTKPRYLVAENVLGIREYIPQVEEAYAERGYRLVTQVYNAVDFGLAQARQRYMLVGVHDGEAVPVLTQPEPPKVTPRLIDFFDQVVEERYYRRRPAFHLREDALERLVSGNGRPVKCAYAYESKGQNSVLHHPLGVGPTIICATDAKVWLGPECWRLLTPSECGRLQGFPVDDGWTAVCSNAQQYKQFGNAVAVPMAQWVARCIKRAMDSGSELD